MNEKKSCFSETTIPYIDLADCKGKLIVIEGTDGVGRSTQIESLSRWLELKGFGVVTTGWARSPLIGKVIERAKAGHSLNVHTYSLLYLADFADRMEHEIIPALKAGFVVLADRYIYTAFARAVVRGADRRWIRDSYGFALEPDKVFYMKIGIKELIPRVINNQTLSEHYWTEGTGEGMDYWESGMDLRLGADPYDSFVEYQKKILAEFELMSKEWSFATIDASRSFEEVNRQIKEGIESVLENE